MVKATRKQASVAHEAGAPEERLQQYAAPPFDGFLTLRFEAVNESPFRFTWSDESATRLDYGAALASSCP